MGTISFFYDEGHRIPVVRPSHGDSRWPGLYRTKSDGRTKRLYCNRGFWQRHDARDHCRHGTALATGLDSTGLGKWSMDLLLQIYLLRKSLRRIKPIRTIVHRFPHNSTSLGNDVGFPTLIHPAQLSELKDVMIDSSHHPE